MKRISIRQFIYPAIVVLAGALCSLMLDRITVAQSPQTWLHCGNADGSTNAACPKCVGTCGLLSAGQRYRVCQDTGTGCTMPANTNAFCSGTLLDGGNGGGCTGKNIGTCQVNIKKCPP
jgi:hypothetical protein